ncbi:MAG: MarC family NAAT transporter [Bacteroidia bacterium]|nr:MarC family NAAT transporter [Bacteroidia bacterium]
MNLLLATFTALFSVVNPLGAMPVFVSMTQREDKAYSRNMAIKSSFFMALILIVFFLAGTYIIDFFGISLEGMKIAGGLIIIQSGFGLLQARHAKSRAVGKRVTEEASTREDISFSPMAMPMLSGPGSIALLIGMSGEADGWTDYLIIISAILLVALLTLGILQVSPRLVRWMGESGISAMSRMLGFIVLTIGIQYIANGVMPLLKEVLAQ